MVCASPSFAESVLASLGSGILAVDAQGRVALANPEARRLLAPDEPAGDLRGRDCRELLAAEPKLVQLLLAACGGGGRLSRVELPLERLGAGCAIGASLFPVREPSGVPVGAVLLFRDLSPLERLEAQQQLQVRLASLGRRAAGLAHEIRNPLASMEVLAGLLRHRSDVASEERELVDGLIAQLRELSKIVATSLDFVRPQQVRRALCSPATLVENALRRVLPGRGRGPVVEKRFAAALPEIVVDEEEITAALADLIANACEALTRVSDAERRLTLQIAARSSELEIAIADTGPGVSRELREKIFQPFFTTRDTGSGIGLAAAQQAVASHGGWIELDDRPARGATFRVRLPLPGDSGG